ncbi:hypothetical protein MASR2M117_08940 [Paludibacter sp.]
MNKLINNIILLSALFTIFSCTDDDLRVKYPVSKPTFNSAVVTQLHEGIFSYGDSIVLNVEVSDKIAPLSTLEIKIIVNDEILSKTSIRTKNNSATYSGAFAVPFGPYMPDNAPVEVHLSSINVEGYSIDTVLDNIIVKRPVIPTMYLYSNAKGTAIELKLTDPANYIYSAEGLTFPNEIKFLLPTKINRFKKVDWTAPVFGKNENGEFGYVHLGGDSLSLSDGTLIGFEKITLDLFKFTVTGSGKKLEPITALDLNVLSLVELTSTNHLGTSVKESWRKGKIYFGKDIEFTVAGMSNLANALSPDFFEVTGVNTAKFIGETGIYTSYYLPSANYLFVEKPDAVYPEALWLDGVGFGRAQGGEKTSSWNWNTPLEYMYCRRVSEGVYQTTIYAVHTDGSDLAEAWRGAFSAKFFHQRGWGGEVDAREYTISSPLLSAPTDHDTGNFYGTDAFLNSPGIYRFTINTTNKTMNFVKM